jgi:UDP-N-acetylmuramate--alanine ligase
VTAPWSGRRLHFVGVGGAGMSAYARAAAALGASVSGSDRASSPYLDALRADGVLDAAIGHDAAHLPAGDDVELVLSSAIGAENPERAAALARGLAVRSRAELLGELSALRRTIAVAGAHGKTTTSSMIVAALRAGGRDPGYLVGGILRETGRNARWSEDEWLVVEADESDRSMLALRVEIAVLTSVELDHHDVFGSLHELEADYRELLAHAPMAVIWDRPELLALRDGPLVAFDAPAPVALRVPGVHNERNAAAALAVARLAGIDPQRAADGLARFEGAVRRFQRLGVTRAGATVYDDYAHHPTEIAATLAAARTLRPSRLIAAFQPHLYSRTAALAREFGEALDGADEVVVLDVYAARERAEDHPGVSGLLVARAAADGRPVHWMPDRAAARSLLARLGGEGAIVLVMGAGDIDALGRELVEHG